jgi:hypothetical protein
LLSALPGWDLQRRLGAKERTEMAAQLLKS